MAEHKLVGAGVGSIPTGSHFYDLITFHLYIEV